MPLGLGVSGAVLDVVGGEALPQGENVLWLALVRGEHVALGTLPLQFIMHEISIGLFPALTSGQAS